MHHAYISFWSVWVCLHFIKFMWILRGCCLDCFITLISHFIVNRDSQSAVVHCGLVCSETKINSTTELSTSATLHCLCESLEQMKDYLCYLMPSVDTLTFSNDLTYGKCHTACGVGEDSLFCNYLTVIEQDKVWCVSLAIGRAERSKFLVILQPAWNLHCLR